MAETIADLLNRTTVEAGVKRIWGVTGDSLNAFNDSLRKSGKIDWMHVRNEEAGAFAAGAEAAATGALAVCAGSCGPGNLHLINGLYDCHRNHVPVLAIAAHIPSSEIGTGYFGKPIPPSCSANAAISVRWCRTPSRCPNCSTAPSAPRSASVGWRCWSFPATSPCRRRRRRAWFPSRRWPHRASCPTTACWRRSRSCSTDRKR